MLLRDSIKNGCWRRGLFRDRWLAALAWGEIAVDGGNDGAKAEAPAAVIFSAAVVATVAAEK